MLTHGMAYNDVGLPCAIGSSADRPPSPARVVEIIHLLRHAGADAGGAFEVVQCGGPDLPRGAEMQQQRTFACGADAGDLVER